MKPDFDSLLSLYRERPISALPSSFAGDVLREIRRRKAESTASRSWWMEFLDLTMRPSPLVAALSVALVVGSLVSYSTRPTPSFSGLGMDVFSSTTLNLPSGRLEYTP